MNKAKSYKSKEAIHLVMRYVDKYGIETVPVHEEVVSKKGAVLVGKVGKPIAIPTIQMLNEQVESGIPTYLFLISKTAPGEYLCHQGTIECISSELPSKEKHLIPDYYRENRITPFVTLWIKISTLAATRKTGLSKLTIASNGKNLLSTLPKSMIGLFLVRQER